MREETSTLVATRKTRMTYMKTDEPVKAGQDDYMTQIMRQLQYMFRTSQGVVGSFSKESARHLLDRFCYNSRTIVRRVITLQQLPHATTVDTLTQPFAANSAFRGRMRDVCTISNHRMRCYWTRSSV
jgi:hypothetical protein